MNDERYSPEMRALLDRLQLLYDQVAVARHVVTEFRLTRADYILYYEQVARWVPTPHGEPCYAAIPVRMGAETTALVEPRAS